MEMDQLSFNMPTETTWPKKIIVYTDGASRGNPGPASIGVYITDHKENEVCQISEPLGLQTNNFAEYSAVIRALQEVIKQNVTEVTLRSDSELLIRQLTGKYKVKSESIKPLFSECQKLIHQIKKIKFEHIRRELNKVADRLANEALDR